MTKSRRPIGTVIDYGRGEQRIADVLGEVERGLHVQVLARLDIDVPALRVSGDEYRRIGRLESEYHTPRRDGADDADGVPEDRPQWRHARSREHTRRRRRRQLVAAHRARWRTCSRKAG